MWAQKGYVCFSRTRKAALAFSVLSMPRVLNLPCCKLLCIRLTALLTPRWMSWSVVAGKPCRSLLYSTSLTGARTHTRKEAQASDERQWSYKCIKRGRRRRAPEVWLQHRVGVVDHGTEAVDVGARQSSTDALFHNVETIINHAAGQLTLFICIHGNGLKGAEMTSQ